MKQALRTAVYPGTFDPFTNGHLDIVRRAAALFDRVLVSVSENPNKQPLLSIDDRRRIVEDAVSGIRNVTVEGFDGLLVDYARVRGVCALIRGLRAVSDFEYEFQMALMNRKLNAELETVFLMPSEQYTYLNSSLVKEVARLGGNVHCFLTPYAVTLLEQRLNQVGD